MENLGWWLSGLAMIGAGIVLMRWAGRYDAASIAVDAAWRMARSGSATGARDELGRVVDEQLGGIRSDAARMGHARTALKHGWRFFIARFVNVAAIVLIVAGLACFAIAAFWPA
jgi:hypothetical protein